MKTVILCGGKGRRLGRAGSIVPKPLIHIGGKPILWHIMKIYSHQGFKHFVLCLGHRGALIKEYFLNILEMSSNLPLSLRSEEISNDFCLDLSSKGIHIPDENSSLEAKIDFVDTGLESMTGARIARVKKYLGKDEDFFLTYGDGVADIDLNELYQYHKKMGKIATVTAVRPVYSFGLLELEKGLVIKFDEKPNMKDLVNGGFMVCNRKIFDYLSEEPDCVLEREPLERLTREGQLAAYRHKSYWKSLDSQKDVDELNGVCEQRAPWEIWKR